jgi:hypothetical protein
MSQRNRYSVLECFESSESLNSEVSDTVSETMSSEILYSSSTPAFPERIYIRSTNTKFSTQVKIILKTLDTGNRICVTALLDCGATGLFLNTKFIEHHELNTKKLPRAVPVYNVDGTLNQGGSIKEEVDLHMVFNEHSENTTFAVCDLGDKDAIIGHTWLYHHNPEINWRTGEVDFTRCPPDCH